MDELEAWLEHTGLLGVWDVDGDGEITTRELHRYFEAGWVAEWDVDGDGEIRRPELAGVLMDLWDFDDDRTLDHEEWAVAHVRDRSFVEVGETQVTLEGPASTGTGRAGSR